MVRPVQFDFGKKSFSIVKRMLYLVVIEIWRLKVKSYFKKLQKKPKRRLSNLTTSIHKSTCFRSFDVFFFDSIDDLGIVLSIAPIKRKAEVVKPKASFQKRFV